MKQQPLAPEDIDKEKPGHQKNPPKRSKRKTRSGTGNGSWAGKLFRLIFLLIVVLVIIVAGVGIVLQYYFPSRTVTPIAERELSRLLNIPVSIETIRFSLLRGAEVRGVTLGSPAPVVQITGLAVDYDLTQLLQGNLLINEVTIDGPAFNLESEGGQWNFQPLLALAGKPGSSQTESEPATSLQDLPPLPFAVDLKKLTVDGVRLELRMEDQLAASLEGLTLRAKGSLQRDGMDLQMDVILDTPAATSPNINLVSSNPQKLEFESRVKAEFHLSTTDLNRFRLAGKANLKSNKLKVNTALPAPDLSLQTDLDAEIHEQRLTLRQLDLIAGESNRLAMAATVEQFLSDPELRLRLKQANFDLDEIVRIAENFIPPLQARGQVEIKNLEIAGRLPGFQPESIGVLGGTIAVDRLSAYHPPTGAKIQGGGMQMSLESIELQRGVPIAAKVSIDLSMDHAQLDNLTVRNLTHKLDLSASGTNLSQIHAGFSTELASVEFKHPKLGVLQVPFTAKGKVEGNINTGNIDTLHLGYAAGDVFHGQLRTSITGFGKQAVNASNKMTLQLGQTLAVLPPEWTERFKEIQLDGKVIADMSIEGKLDKSFHPAQAKARTNIRVEEVRAHVMNPQVKVQGLNLKMTFPAEYDAERGARIQALLVETEIGSIQALNNWALDTLKAKTKLSMESFFNLDPAFSIPVPITHKTSMTMGRIQSTKPNFLARGLTVDTSLKANLHQEDIRNTTIETDISLAGFEGLDRFTAGPLQTRLVVDIRDTSLEHTRSNMNVRIESASTRQEEVELSLGPVILTSLSHQNIQNGTIELNRMSVEVGALLKAEIQGTLEEWGSEFDLKQLRSTINLAALLEKIPETNREGLEGLNIDGTAELKLTAKGRLPDAAQIKTLQLPLQAQAGFDLKHTTITSPEHGLEIKELNGQTRLDYEGERIGVSGTLDIHKFFISDSLGDTWLDPALKFDYELRRFESLRIKNHELRINSLGFLHTLTGRIEGLKPFITGKTPPHPEEMLRNIHMSMETQNGLDVNKTLGKGSIPGDRSLHSSGMIQSELGLNLVAGQHIEVDGRVHFDRFHLDLPPHFKAGAINGSLLFNKTLLLDADLLTSKKDTSGVAQRGFFSQLRDFSRHKNILRIDALEAKDHKVSNIGLDLFYRNNRLVIEKYLFDVLNGSVGGRVFLANTKEGPALKFYTEFAGVDFGQLIPNQEATDQEAVIDGSVELGFQMQPGGTGGEISLGQITAKVAITQIGAETLDRLLFYLDPEESKPAIVDTRAKLKLASPHRILITLENGNLNVEVWLKNKVLGSILKAPELKRVPISSLKQFRQISDQLQALGGLRDTLKYLAANGIEFGPDKEIILY